jgi:hypothetical protein
MKMRRIAYIFSMFAIGITLGAYIGYQNISDSQTSTQIIKTNFVTPEYKLPNVHSIADLSEDYSPGIIQERQPIRIRPSVLDELDQLYERYIAFSVNAEQALAAGDTNSAFYFQRFKRSTIIEMRGVFHRVPSGIVLSPEIIEAINDIID